MRRSMLPALLAIFFISSCKKETGNNNGPNLVLKFKFDPSQARLNNTGQPQAMPAGHAGQSPTFNKMSAHYVELAPGALTPLGSGAVLYRAAESTAGGSNAIDFDKSKFAGNNEVFFSIPLKNITPSKIKTWLSMRIKNRVTGDLKRL